MNIRISFLLFLVIIISINVFANSAVDSMPPATIPIDSMPPIDTPIEKSPPIYILPPDYDCGIVVCPIGEVPIFTGEYDARTRCPITVCVGDDYDEIEPYPICDIIVCPPGEVGVFTGEYDARTRCPITVCVGDDYDRTEPLPIDRIKPIPPVRDIPDVTEPIYILPPSRDIDTIETIEVEIVTDNIYTTIRVDVEDDYTVIKDLDYREVRDSEYSEKRSLDYKIRTREKLIVEDYGLYVEYRNIKTRIEISPSEIYTVAKEKIGISDPYVELRAEDVPFYEVSGLKKARVFGIFPVEMPIVSRVGIQEATIEIVEIPWWSIFTI